MTTATLEGAGSDSERQALKRCLKAQPCHGRERAATRAQGAALLMGA